MYNKCIIYDYYMSICMFGSKVKALGCCRMLGVGGLKPTCSTLSTSTPELGKGVDNPQPMHICINGLA